MQSLNGKVTGDDLTAAEWNQMPSELQNIITASGQTLSALDLNQLAKGVCAYVSTCDGYTCSGPANSYILTPITGFQGPTSYFDGMRVRFVPNVDNVAGAVSVDVNGLGSRFIVREDGLGNSVATEYQTDTMVELRYDDSSNDFKLVRFRNASTTQIGVTRIAEQSEVDGGIGSFNYVTPSTLQNRLTSFLQGDYNGVSQNTASDTPVDINGINSFDIVSGKKYKLEIDARVTGATSGIVIRVDDVNNTSLENTSVIGLESINGIVYTDSFIGNIIVDVPPSDLVLATSLKISSYFLADADDTITLQFLRSTASGTAAIENIGYTLTELT